MSRELSGADRWRQTQRPTRTNQVLIRLLDLVGAGFGLLLLSPLLLGIALTVRLTSPGPALFRSTRIGRHARPFILLKFRSMIEGAESLGPGITSAEDTRITPIGRRLRSLKLDELPQLINILRGDMSLVGPRPEDPEYVALYTEEQMGILEVRPGLTSPASLLYRDEEALLTGEDWQAHYIHEVMPAKLAMDSEYCTRRTVWSDLKVILATIVEVGKHVHRH